jgi:proteic killer suppression protein
MKAARRKMHWIDAARSVEALRVPAGNRLEALKGDRAGMFSVRINDQYRVTFRFEQGHAYEVGCEDYH